MAQSSGEIYWSAIIADFGRSGMTHVQFCQTRRIPLHSFRNWLYRLRPTSASPDRFPSHSPVRPIPAKARSTPAAFVPIHIRAELSDLADARSDGSSPRPLELVLGDDRRVRIPVGFDPTTLRQLLEVLEERP